MIEIRPAHWPGDRAGVGALDTAFTTEIILTGRARPDGFDLATTERPTTKRFPIDDLDSPDRPWDRAWVAAEDGAIRGLAATGYSPWNRRLVLWHFYVDAPFRGLGLGRRLLAPVLAHGEALGASQVWLETSNLNVPGVAAYHALGFRTTGLDLTLYEGTPAEGEFAIFLSLALDGRAPANT